MSQRYVISFLAVLLAFLLTACGTSPPTQFIALSSHPGEIVAASAQSAAPVVVGRVNLPPELDRLPLVSYGANGQVEVNGTIRWAAPLDESIRRTLAFNLANRLGDKNVVLPGQPTPAGSSRLLVVTIQTFAPKPNHQVILDAHWSVTRQGSPSQPQAEGNASITAQVQSANSTDLGAAMSAALATLSDQIAGFLDKHR